MQTLVVMVRCLAQPRLVAIAMAGLMLFAGHAHVFAQNRDLRPAFGYVVWADATLVSDFNAAEGFGLPVARLRMRDRAGEGVGYFVQADFARSPALLDARIELALSDRVDLYAGLFKTPFSREYLTFLGEIPLLQRGAVVNTLATKRRVGVSLRLDSGNFRVYGGIFNGSNTDRSGVSDGLIAVARLERAGERWTIGGGLAAGKEDQVRLAPVDNSFTGDRIQFGADIEYASATTFFLAEIAAGRLSPDGPVGADDMSPWGVTLSGHQQIVGRHRAIARIDFLDPDVGNDEQLFVSLGYRYDVNALARILLVYRVDTDDLDTGSLTGRLQVAVR